MSGAKSILGRRVVVLRIVIESLWAIISNLGQAARVSLLPAIVFALCAVVIAADPGARGLLLSQDAAPSVGVSAWIFGAIAIPIGAYFLAWSAVAWHRFVLREEGSGLLPMVRGRPILPYAGRGILVGCLITAILVGLYFAVTLVLVVSFGSGVPSSLAWLITVLGQILLAYLWLRWGLALVATALDKPMRLGEAWRATRATKGLTLGIAVITVFLVQVLVGLLALLNPNLLAVELALNAAILWVAVLLGISSLTTLYGYTVEGRH